MEDIIKWFVQPEGAPAFEIDVSTHAGAIAYVERNFRGSGDVRIIKVTYRAITRYPYIVNA